MRVVVLGAGYAGVALARRLEARLPADVDLMVVDENGDHLVQHELHRVVRRPSFAEEIVLPLDDLFDRAEVRTARVEAVDHESGTATLADGESIEYDFAAVCLGAETNFYDLPGVEEHATPLKRIGDALAIRERFFEILDAGGSSVVVGGAGLSGVQVAGELAELAREEGVADRIAVTLLEQRKAVAPTFPANFQRSVREELEERGVVVRTDATVQSATDEAVRLIGNERLAYDQFVWTGGIRGPDALGGERPQVRPTMRLGDGTFVVGDTAAVVDAEGQAVPASAQSAVREARVVADNVLRLVEHERGDEGVGLFEPRLERFTFDSPGWLVSVGNDAVAQVGPSVFTGRAAKALKTTVGVGYLSSIGGHRRVAEFVGEELSRGDTS
jgi:NADH dehydrogenase